MKRWLGWGRAATAAALTMILAVPVVAQADNWVLLVKKSGTVEARQGSSTSWSRVFSNKRLAASDYARTGVNGAAQVRMSDQSVIAMGPKTTMQVKQFIAAAERNTEVEVTAGSVRTKVARFGGQSRFQVSTPNAVLAAQGTDFLVEVIDPNAQAMEDGWVQAQSGGGGVVTQAAVFEGRVQATSLVNNQTATLNPGDTLLVDQNGNLITNPPAFPYQAAVDAGNSSALDVGQMIGPLVPLDYGTVFEFFGNNETGLTADTRNTSTGTGDDGLGGTPVLINPQAETTGTLIIELHP